MNLAKLSYRAQVYRLRKLAEKALQLYSLKKVKIILVMHGENATFKIITSLGKKYALRIHRLDYHSHSGILTELTWMQELAKDNVIQVPQPIPGNDGAFIQKVKIEEIENARYVVLFPWLEGRFCGKSLTAEKMIEVGVCTAKLQQHGQKYFVEAKKNRLCWDIEGFFGENAVASTKYFNHTNKKQTKVLENTIQKIRNQLKDLHLQKDYFGLIHADLHWGNFLFHNKKVSIIDFDDCGLGYYMYDLAVTIGAMKNLPQRDTLKQAIIDGYHQITTITDYHLELITLFYVVRHLCVLGWICDRTDLPYFHDKIPARIQEAVNICQRYNQAQFTIY